MTNEERDALQRLSGALAIPTLSAENAAPEMARFAAFRDYLRRSFPLVHKELSCEVAGGDSLLYTWRGGEGKPFALLAHQDVVPVEEGTEKDWTHPPFAGTFDDTYIWGRGASDVKCLLLAELEAVETLLMAGYKPDRDIYLAFGHNEEIIAGGGGSGAGAIAALLESRGVRLEFVLDEGGAVITDSFMGLPKPIAAIGVSEKGYCDFMISVEGDGGHSSEPPNVTAAAKLAKIILAAKPGKARLTAATEGMLKTIGRNKTGLLGFILRHPRGFWPVLRAVFLRDKQTAAMMRTTCTPTMLNASPQANVLPQMASVTFNSRILPGDNVDELIAGLVAKAERMGFKVHAKKLRGNPPPKETSQDTDTYRRLSGLAASAFGAIPVAYLVMGGTDSREYARVADELYRFCPFELSRSELSAMHSTNERLRCDSYIKGIQFLKTFILQSSGGQADGK